MSPKFERDDVDEVRERANIVEVVGDHVRLRKAGRDFKGLCPFHQEKTPSFVVNPEKGLYFCLAGETRVITSYGVHPIANLAGTAQRVLTMSGGSATWVDAPFYSFGDQELLEITLSRNGIEKTIRATAEHRWFVRKPNGKGRRELTTVELKAGQTLSSCYSRAPASYSPQRPLTPSPFGIARGITFGDGTRFHRGSTAYLYGEKDAELIKWFPLSDRYDRSGGVQICDLPAYFKDEFPSVDESASYLYGWLAGYFAADGDVAADACVSLNAATRRNLEYVREICNRIGIGTYSIREYQRRGFAKAAGAEEAFYDGPIYRLTIAGADLTPDFFLISEHRRRFEAHPKAYERRHWVVRDVAPTGRTEEVFCAVVPEHHAFTLEDNILTGNCHGCNAGGSVFTFLEQVEGLSFPEAVESLARRYGVELREVAGGKRQESPRARLFDLQESAVRRYQEYLREKDAEPVRAYLESRGITTELAEKYSIGFGGWRRDALTRTAHRAGYKAEELMSAGLATRDARGLRDTFYGRLLFPIFDPSGRAVGIGGRVLPDEFRTEEVPDAPKYLNSRESPIFKKSRILYGTNWARADVVQRKRLVLVEGYTDVIALHAAGIGEAVATCGTSLTEDHMKEISTRFGDVRVILCLDADAAGQAAMSRDRTEELAGNFSPGDQVRGSGWIPIGRGWLPEVNVANLPQGKDPADFVRAEGAHGVGTVLDAAVPLVEFLLRRAIEGADLRSPEGRTHAVRKGVDVLRQVGDTLLRHEYGLWLADRTGVDPREVMRSLDQQEAQTRRRPQQQAQAPVALTGHHRIEHEALRGVLTHPSLLAHEKLAPTEDDFTLPVHRSLFRLVSTEMAEQGDVDAGRIASRVQDPDLRRIASELSVGETPDIDVATDTLGRLKVMAADRNIVERKNRLRSLDPDRDAAAYDALFEELLELEMHKRALSAAE